MSCDSEKRDDLMGDFKFDEKDYDFEVLAAAKLDELAEQRILQNVLNKVGLQPEAKTAHRKISRRRLFVFALVAVLLIFGGSLAVADVVTDGQIAAFFGADIDQREILDDHTQFLNIADTDQGSTVTVRQVVGDDHNVFVQFDVEAAEGIVLDSSWYLFEDTFVQLKAGNPAGYHFEVLADDDPTDNKISMLLCYDSQEKVRGKTLNITLGNLYTADAQGEDIVVVPGEWQFKVPLQYKNMSVVKELAEPLLIEHAAYKQKAIVTEIEISPVALTMIGEKGFFWDEKEDAEVFNNYMEQLVITLQDGSVIDHLSSGTGSNGDVLSIIYQFGCILDVEEIVKIEFMGQELKFK